MEFTKEEIEKLSSTTVKELAMQLDDGIINAGIISEDMSVIEYLKYYFRK